MKAALLYEGRRELEVKEVKEPEIRGGEALLKVGATGICHSDLHIVDGFLKPPRYPHVLGHEIAGVVEEAKPTNRVEKEVLERIEQTGGRAIIYFYITCGSCEYCISGKENLCYTYRRIGFEEWGGYAEYVRVPIVNLVPLPEELGFEAGILADAGATAYRALSKAGVQVGSNILIIGVGGLGSMALQIAVSSGATVGAIDIEDTKLKYARELGAVYTLNFKESADKVWEETEGRGVEVVVDTVGKEETIKLGLEVLKRGGTLILLGYGKDSRIDYPVSRIIYEDYKIVGSRASAKHDLYQVVELAKKEKIRLNVTSEYKIEDVNRALKDLRHGRILGRGIIRF